MTVAPNISPILTHIIVYSKLLPKFIKIKPIFYISYPIMFHNTQ